MEPRNRRARPGRAGRLLVAAAVAAGIVAVPATAMAFTDLDQAQEGGDASQCIQPRNENSACYHGLAQTVTVGLAGELSSVQLQVSLSSFSTTTQDLVVEIHAGAPDGALLATSAPVAPSEMATDPAIDWVTVPFPIPAAVAVGDVIAIVLPDQPDSSNPDPAWIWHKSSVDSYAGGVAWGGPPGPWDSWFDGSDFAFRTFVTTSPALCDLAVALPGGALVDDELDVTIGTTLDIFLFDYPPLTAVTIAIEGAGQSGSIEVITNPVGEASGSTLTFEPGDEGAWTLSAYPTADPGCIDSVTLNAVVGPPLPPASLPDTAMTARDAFRAADLAVLLGCLAMVAGLAGLAGGRKSRPASGSGRDREERGGPA